MLLALPVGEQDRRLLIGGKLCADFALAIAACLLLSSYDFWCSLTFMLGFAPSIRLSNREFS